MSVTMESLEELEGMDLDGVPPCEVAHSGKPCHAPSAARARFECPRCGPMYLFVCRRAVEGLNGTSWPYCSCNKNKVISWSTS